MIAEALLSHLDGIRRMGADRWLACCPAHDDKRPSLSIREVDGDRVLVHCWAGCSVGEVLDAVGLTFDALYPTRPTHHARPEKWLFPAADVLRATAREALIVAVAASNLGNGIDLSAEDRQRLLIASSRLAAAVQESGHE